MNDMLVGILGFVAIVAIVILLMNGGEGRLA